MGGFCADLCARPPVGWKMAAAHRQHIGAALLAKGVHGWALVLGAQNVISKTTCNFSLSFLRSQVKGEER